MPVCTSKNKKQLQLEQSRMWHACTSMRCRCRYCQPSSTSPSPWDNSKEIIDERSSEVTLCADHPSCCPCGNAHGAFLEHEWPLVLSGLGAMSYMSYMSDMSGWRLHMSSCTGLVALLGLLRSDFQQTHHQGSHNSCFPAILSQSQVCPRSGVSWCLQALQTFTKGSSSANC